MLTDYYELSHKVILEDGSVFSDMTNKAQGLLAILDLYTYIYLRNVENRTDSNLKTFHY
jgi:hypothetical protein